MFHFPKQKKATAATLTTLYNIETQTLTIKTKDNKKEITTESLFHGNMLKGTMQSISFTFEYFWNNKYHQRVATRRAIMLHWTEYQPYNQAHYGEIGVNSTHNNQSGTQQTTLFFE